MFGLIHCIFQTPAWFLVALERMPVSHHDQILVLLQVGAPGEVGSVRILSRAQSPGIRAETLRAEAQDLRQLWTCWPLSHRDHIFSIDHNYKVSGLGGLHVCKNHFEMHGFRKDTCPQLAQPKWASCQDALDPNL